jgi:dolichol-phosphate mannosyltransferase
VGVAQFIYGVHYGWLIAGLAGAALGAVWNYAASSIFTWGNKGRD